MKTFKKFNILVVAMSFMTFSCSDPLEEETFSVLGPTNFYNTAEDAESLLNGVYAPSQGYRDIARDYLLFNEMTTDILIERGGGINATLLYLCSPPKVIPNNLG